MNDAQRRRHERFSRVRSFCESQPVLFPEDSRGALALAAIITAINKSEELDALQSTHRSHAKQGTSQRREGREELLSQAKAIIATSRIIGLEHEEIRGRFKLSSSRPNDQNLLSDARSIHAEALPFKALFLEYNMPQDFLETFGATIVKFEQSFNRQSTGTGGRTQARAGIDQVQKQATIELQKLDTVMRNRFKDNEAMLAAWESASRLERAPR
ncbi:MAG TPA: hypothetical protein VJS44_11150, partial [Pyrinomonadaceae bacterium]|nr:hypothetical protein [Pyrinomonadaceae bacterium]